MQDIHWSPADGTYERHHQMTAVAARVARVRDVMYTNPKTLPRDATVGEVRTFFDNHRARVALLGDRDLCTGTINRADIPATAHDGEAARPFAGAPLTIHPDTSLADAHRRLEQTADGRLVVVDDRDQLLGLLCHNRAGDGFCNDRSSCRRPAETAAEETRWHVVGTNGLTARTLVAAPGKTINIGDLVNLPPDTETRWLVIDVHDEPHDDNGRIAIVEAFTLPH